jgi:Na+/H+ antiporter NhaD/arsenite permease-like protein
LTVSFQLNGKAERMQTITNNKDKKHTKKQQRAILILGIFSFIFVPVFKTITHLPPFMGMLFSVGIMWVVTEIMHGKGDTDEKKYLTLVHALHKIDISSILFFLGILMSISALESADLLKHLELWLSHTIGNLSIIVMTIGLFSSVIDNVPLVAATQGMFSLSQYPMDSYIWEFLAFCTGTGGSILIIGSAAGVAAMGIEKIDFLWYVKKIGWLALIGYFAGAFTYMAIEMLFY